MRQRSIEIVGLESDVFHQLLRRMVVDGPHQRQTVHYHDYNHADILGESEKQFPEIVALHNRGMAVETGDLGKTAHQNSHILSPEAFYFLYGAQRGIHRRCQQYCQHHVAVGVDMGADGYCRGHSRHRRMKAEAVALQRTAAQNLRNGLAVAGTEQCAGGTLELPPQAQGSDKL